MPLVGNVILTAPHSAARASRHLCHCPDFEAFTSAFCDGCTPLLPAGQTGPLGGALSGPCASCGVALCCRAAVPSFPCVPPSAHGDTSPWPCANRRPHTASPRQGPARPHAWRRSPASAQNARFCPRPVPAGRWAACQERTRLPAADACPTLFFRHFLSPAPARPGGQRCRVFRAPLSHFVTRHPSFLQGCYFFSLCVTTVRTPRLELAYFAKGALF